MGAEVADLAPNCTLRRTCHFIRARCGPAQEVSFSELPVAGCLLEKESLSERVHFVSKMDKRARRCFVPDGNVAITNPQTAESLQMFRSLSL